MKKFIYISGIIFINLLLAGVISKVNHWHGAGILLTFTIILMVFLFFPIALVTSYKQHKDKFQLHLYIIAYLTIALELFGMLFKIQHWPGADLFLFIGLPLPFVLFLPFYVRYHNKTKANSDKNFLSFIFFMIYLAIISSLLALDISKNLYDAFIPQTEQLIAQSNAFEQKSDQYYETFFQKPENISENESIEILNTTSDKLYMILEDAKREMILVADKRNKQFISNSTIEYSSLIGLIKKNIAFSFANQRGDLSKENIIESKLVDFENAINRLSNKYKLNDILASKDTPYSLTLIRDNMYEDQFRSKSLVENLSALSFMQFRVRFIEYQVLNLLKLQKSKLQN